MPRHSFDRKRATSDAEAVRRRVTDELAFGSYARLVGRDVWDALTPRHTAPAPKSAPTDPPSVVTFLDGNLNTE